MRIVIGGIGAIRTIGVIGVAQSRFDTTDARIVRPYRGLDVGGGDGYCFFALGFLPLQWKGRTKAPFTECSL